MAPTDLAMSAPLSAPTYHNLSVTPSGLGEVNINYVEAGSPDLPTVLLLQGFPSFSNQYRGLIDLLSPSYHVLAPDFPGYGLTTVPTDFKYTFDNLGAAIGAWLAALQITSYAMYLFDYGTPVGHRLALANPNHVKAIVVQNGNSYVEGFGHPFWNPIESLWKSGDSQKDRDWLAENYLGLAGTKGQYYTGVPDKDQSLVNPLAYNTDYFLNLAGKEHQRVQLDLFYDYRTNIDLYPKVHEWFRKSQVPCLVAWAKGDPIFIVPGAEAYKRDLPNAEIHILDAGHFALETKRWEVAELMKGFLKKVKF